MIPRVPRLRGMLDRKVPTSAAIYPLLMSTNQRALVRDIFDTLDTQRAFDDTHYQWSQSKTPLLRER